MALDMEAIKVRRGLEWCEQQSGFRMQDWISCLADFDALIARVEELEAQITAWCTYYCASPKDRCGLIDPPCPLYPYRGGE